MAGKRGRSGKNRRSAAYSTRAQIFKRQDISASEKRICFLQSFQLSVSVFTAVIAHAAVVAGEEDDLLPDASTANERGDEHSHLILYAIAALLARLARDVVPLPVRFRKDGSEYLDFQQFGDRMFQRYFLFDNLSDLTTAVNCLMPEHEWTPSPNVPSCSAREALAVLIAHLRLGYTTEHVLKLTRLEWSESKYIRTYNSAAAFLHRKYGAKIRFDEDLISDGQVMEACRDAIQTKFGLALDMAGLIDGTHVPIARPCGHPDLQQAMYDGHHKVRNCRSITLVSDCFLSGCHVY